MPKLVTFLPCENLLTDPKGATSLISIMDVVTALVPPGRKLSRQAGYPISWYVFSLWFKQEEDKDKVYEQRVAFILPDGEVVGQGEIQTFEMSGDKVRVMQPIEGFPIGMEGRCLVKMYIRLKGTEGWEEAAEYPITVKHEWNGMPSKSTEQDTADAPASTADR